MHVTCIIMYLYLMCSYEILMYINVIMQVDVFIVGESISFVCCRQESAQFRGRSLLQHVDHGGGVQQMRVCAIWHRRTKLAQIGL